MALTQSQIDIVNSIQKKGQETIAAATNLANLLNHVHATIQPDNPSVDPASLTFAGLKARFGANYTALVDALAAKVAEFPDI